MSMSVCGFDPAAFAATASLNRATSTGTSSPATSNATITQPDAVTTFKNYMKLSPAERMEENWLKAHGLSKEKLAAMDPKDREAVMKQMKDDIERQLKEQTEKKAQVVDLTV